MVVLPPCKFHLYITRNGISIDNILAHTLLQIKTNMILSIRTILWYLLRKRITKKRRFWVRKLFLDRKIKGEYSYTGHAFARRGIFLQISPDEFVATTQSPLQRQQKVHLSHHHLHYI